MNEEQRSEEERRASERRNKERRRWATLIHDPERRMGERRSRSPEPPDLDKPEE